MNSTNGATSSHAPKPKILEKIAGKITAVLARDGTCIVAIDGPACAGKSTLANILREKWGAQIFCMDDFFLPQSRKTVGRLSEPGGNVDYERFFAEVLCPLSRSDDVFYKRFDCAAGEFLPAVKIAPTPVSIVEGVYSFHPFFGDIYDLKIFLTIDSVTQKERLKTRGEYLSNRYLTEWIPLENEYFRFHKIEKMANIKGDFTS